MKCTCMYILYTSRLFFILHRRDPLVFCKWAEFLFTYEYLRKSEFCEAHKQWELLNNLKELTEKVTMKTEFKKSTVVFSGDFQ